MESLSRRTWALVVSEPSNTGMIAVNDLVQRNVLFVTECLFLPKSFSAGPSVFARRIFFFLEGGQFFSFFPGRIISCN